MHMRMRRGLAADQHAFILQNPDLIPAHIVSVSTVNRLCGNEYSIGEIKRFQPGSGFGKNRQIGIINGDRDGFIRQLQPLLKMRDNLVEWPDVIIAICQHIQMRLKLIKPNICAGIFVLAKAMIHQDSGIIGGKRAAAGETTKGQRQQSGLHYTATANRGYHAAHRLW